MTSTYIIRHKETKEQWVADSGKRAWAKPGYAKLAWLGYGTDDIEPIFKLWYPDKPERGGRKERQKFDEQDQYEIVELKSSDTLLLVEAVALLKRVAIAYDRTGNPNFALDIKGWLEENGYGEK